MARASADLGDRLRAVTVDGVEVQAELAAMRAELEALEAELAARIDAERSRLRSLAARR